MLRATLSVFVLLCACSAAPEVEERFVPGAPANSSTADPCDQHPEPTAWVRNSVLSALQDQMGAICACFREDAEGVKLYVAAYVMVDGQVRVDVLGHRSTVADQIDCFQDRTASALINWVALGGGWFNPSKTVATPPTVYEWHGISCAATEADLPLNGPLLSAAWLEANPDGVLYPAEMPEEACYNRLRRNVRINFPMEVRPPPPACEKAGPFGSCPVESDATQGQP